MAPVIGGNLFNLVFGKVYDAHTVGLPSLCARSDVYCVTPYMIAAACLAVMIEIMLTGRPRAMMLPVLSVSPRQAPVQMDKTTFSAAP